eukprot:gene8316-biopygen22620
MGVVVLMSFWVLLKPPPLVGNCSQKPRPYPPRGHVSGLAQSCAHRRKSCGTWTESTGAIYHCLCHLLPSPPCQGAAPAENVTGAEGAGKCKKNTAVRRRDFPERRLSVESLRRSPAAREDNLLGPSACLPACLPFDRVGVTTEPDNLLGIVA